MHDERLVVVIARTRTALAGLTEELMRINNEQTNAFRSLAKEIARLVHAQGERDARLLEELTQLNNELAALQREMAKKNVELERLKSGWLSPASCAKLVTRCCRRPEVWKRSTWLKPLHLIWCCWTWKCPTSVVERENLIRDLQAALANVKTLRKLLPICAGCKKIRDDAGYWQSVEGYMLQHADVRFSHGLCPDCLRECYAELDDDLAPPPSGSR